MKFLWNSGFKHYEGKHGSAHLIFGSPMSGPIARTHATQIFTNFSRKLDALLLCTQVHGRVIASVSAEPGRPIEGLHDVGRCDGIISDLKRTGLLIWTADCVPVLIAGDGVVGVAHAGWRGCAAGIVPRLIRRFQIEYGVSIDKLNVALGPSIGPCHYPVGDEVIDALGAHSLPDQTWCDRPRVDLRSFLHLQIAACGLSLRQITNVGGCTSCDPRFASYRRDGSPDRQFSMVFTE